MKCNRKTIGVFLFLLAGTFIFYRSFLDNFFVYDDFKYLENMYRGPLSVLFGYGNVRFVSNLVWWPLHAIAGNNPFAYNLFSVVLHAVNAMVLFCLLGHLTKNREFSSICAALFCFYSTGCDAVLWKSANNTLLASLLYLLTLNLYVMYRQHGIHKYLLASLSCFVLAIFSKEDAASIPFIIILIEIIFFRGIDNFQSAIRKTVPFVVIIVVYIIVYLLAGKFTDL